MMAGFKFKFYFLFIVLFLFSSSSIKAHDYETHKEELASILFEDGLKSKILRGNKNFEILCKAARLAIDFTSQPYGDIDMIFLKQNGVNPLPSINEIEYASNQHHQRYTHRGWDYNYPIDKAKWEKRKQILISAVKRIGNFSKVERIKIEAFAALVYDIHILGDHIGDSESTRWDRLRLTSVGHTKGRVLTASSSPQFDSNANLYDYLIYHVRRLFREQENSIIYQSLEHFLLTNNNYFYGREEDSITIEEIKNFAIETRKNLQLYLSKLLKNEAFFRRAFYDN